MSSERYWVYDYLVDQGNGEIIGEAAQEGNLRAQSIIRYYKMHEAAPGDPGAKAFLENELKNWIRERN